VVTACNRRRVALRRVALFAPVALVLAAAAPSAAGASARDAGSRSVSAVPILMYHVIAQAPSDAPYPQLYVTPDRFAAHMAYLGRHRYNVVTLREVWNHWRRGTPLASKPVVVSFDDGFQNWYTQAYPVLRRRGWVGVMNLALSHLAPADVPWVRTLVDAGWELASHTVTHRDLTLLDDRDLRREVWGSRVRLRSRFGVPVNFFCYPYGRFDARVVAAVREAGYLGATTTMDGFAVPRSPYTLRRVRVSGSDTAADLGTKLAPRHSRARE
jgi:peptidoglycan/xylan/chitin deacetylase (PgdA/CDA1 family)